MLQQLMQRTLRKYTKQQLDSVVRLRLTTDYNSEQISQITGVSTARVKQLLRKLKISRPSGFQLGNPGFIGNHSDDTKSKIRKRHLASGHKPSKESVSKGQPKTLERWQYHKRDAVKLYMRTYSGAAEIRNLVFDLSRAEFEALIFQPCYYCNEPPSARVIAKGLALVCNGIDRADNNLGYTKDNTLTACKVCNRMKFQWSVSEFINHCSKVHYNKGNICE